MGVHIGIVTLLLGIASAGTASAQTSLVLIAKTGDAAPGDGGEVFRVVSSAGLMPDGSIALTGFLETGVGGVTNASSRGVWRYANGSLSEVLRSTDSVPGVPDATFSTFSQYQESDAGNAGFNASLTIGQGGVTSSDSIGIWLETDSGLELQARRGSPAVGIAGADYDSLSILNLAPSGAYSFWGRVRNPGVVTMDNDTCLWAFRGGTLELVMREGDPVPALANTTYASLFGVDTTPIRDDGSFLALGFVNVDTGGPAPSTRATLWHVTTDDEQPIVMGGDPAPGTGTGVFDQFVFTPIWTDEDDIIFRASLDPSSVTSGFSGLWRIRDGLTELLLRSGEPAPGTGGEFSTVNRIAGAGNTVLLTSSLSNTTNPFAVFASAWLLRDGQLTPVTNVDGTVPGLPGAAFFTIDLTYVNESGDAVFVASLLPGSGGVTAFENQGIWAYSSQTQELTLVAMDGRLLDASPCQNGSDEREVNFLALGSGIAPDGSFPFTVEFNDGTSAAYIHTFEQDAGLCEADFDCSGVVDLGDFGVFGSAFNSLIGDPNYLPAADFDGDGDIDLGDFGIFGSQFTLGFEDCSP